MGRLFFSAALKLITHRKQVKVKTSPGRPSLTSDYKNKWKFTYSIQWTLNNKAIAESSKTDGIFPFFLNLPKRTEI